jgi:hypothetical protein
MIRHILVLLFLAAAASQAETLQEAVSARQPRLMDPAEILRELTARPQIAMTNIVIVAKPAAQVAWEKDATAEIESFVEAVTGDRRNALQRIALLDSRGMLAAVRGGKAGRPTKQAEIMDRSDALTIMYLDSMRATESHPAYPWPLPADFGQDTSSVTTVTLVPGKAWWQREGLKAPPTIDQISNLMK